MPRKENEDVPEGIGPVLRQEFGPDQPTLADLYRLLKEGFERERQKNKSLLDKWMYSLVKWTRFRKTGEVWISVEHA